MIRFHQTFGAHAGRELTFEKEVITLGRLPTCDIAFDARADLDASGQHAEVRREGGAWHVLDANSRNGTWLNGQRISRAQLKSGDELELGRGGPRIRVEIVEPHAGAPAPYAPLPHTPLGADLPPRPVPVRAAPSHRPAPVPRRGFPLGLALMLSIVALLFAALAAGVLLWRLRTSSAAETPPPSRLSAAGVPERAGT